MFRCVKIMNKRTKKEIPFIAGDQYGQLGEWGVIGEIST
jgi:hypothetical protein